MVDYRTKDAPIPDGRYSESARKVLILGRDGVTRATALNPIPTDTVITGDVTVDIDEINAEFKVDSGHDLYLAENVVGDGTWTITFDLISGLSLEKVQAVENKTTGQVYRTSGATVTTTSIALSETDNPKNDAPEAGDVIELVYRGTSRFDNKATEATLNTVNTNLGTIETDIEATNTALGTIKTNLETIETDIEATNTALATVNTNLGTIEIDIEATNTALGIVNTNLGTIETDIEATNVLLTSVDTAIEAVQTVLEDVHDNPANLLRIAEQDPIYYNFSSEVIASETNATDGTYNYYIDMDTFRELGLQLTIDGGSGSVTVTVEGTMQDDGTAPASCTYVDISTLYGSASWTASTILVDGDKIMGEFKYLKVKVVADTSGADDSSYTIRGKKLY